MFTKITNRIEPHLLAVAVAVDFETAVTARNDWLFRYLADGTAVAV